MNRSKTLKRILSTMLILVMVFASITIDLPREVQAAVSQEGLISIDIKNCMNTSEKYLYLSGTRANTFNFNIKKEAKVEGATYTWYIKTDKGNPDAVIIDKKTGVVTAREAGTAYIRCKITFTDKTVYRPEARVTIRNNITAVKISNLPENDTISAGSSYDFNRKVLDTEAGKKAKTQGITRWEITADTAGVEAATAQGIVFPVEEGEFKLRAVCFQSAAKYKAWLADKEANKTNITASSEWTVVKVTSWIRRQR